MKTSIETITPEKARDLLKGNTDNRPVRESWVETLAEDMKKGLFRTTHQGIAIAPNGRVLDGQHRLLAIVKAGIPIQIMVSRGVDEDLYRVIDGGKTRIIADRLRLLTDPHSNRIAVAIVTAYLICASHRMSAGITADMVDDCFLDMCDAFQHVSNLWRQKRVNITVSEPGAAMVVYYHHHKHKAEPFIHSYLTGEELKRRDPAYMLREAAMSGRLGANRHERYWKSVGACRADFEGRTLGSLIAATSDFAGNQYKRLVFERRAVAEKGVETKRRASYKA